MDCKIYTFCLPDIGEGVVEGEIVEWLKSVGDQVKQDEPVVIVMTDKATVELPSPYPGKIHKQYYKVGEIAIKDKPLYDVLLEEKAILSSEKEKMAEMIPLESISNKQEKPTTPSEIETNKRTGKTKAIPKVRHEAKEWDIDIDQLSGSGSNGRITEDDLHQALIRKQAVPSEAMPAEGAQPLVGIRGLMARRMHETRIPQFSYFEQTEVTRLIQLRQNIKKKADPEGVNLSYMPFFIRALSFAIKRFPEINASLDMGSLKATIHQQQNIGIAMATAQGLIVPVLKGVEKMGLPELIQAYDALKIKASSGKLTSTDMKEATITLSNFGILGGEGMWATPMISHPEVAILAVAMIRKVPVVKEEKIIIQDVLPVSWSFDHRLIDGELAAKVSHYYCTLLKEPASLL